MAGGVLGRAEWVRSRRDSRKGKLPAGLLCVFVKRGITCISALVSHEQFSDSGKVLAGDESLLMSAWCLGRSGDGLFVCILRRSAGILHFCQNPLPAAGLW